MGKSKRIIKGIYSLLHKIDLHLEKFENSHKNGDQNAMKYYVKEIESSFWNNIQKELKKIRVDEELQKELLSYQSKIDEITSISWNES